MEQEQITYKAKKNKPLIIITIIICIIYIINPGAGVFEFIPDNLPFVGNLDEAAATLLLVRCFRALKN